MRRYLRRHAASRPDSAAVSECGAHGSAVTTWRELELDVINAAANAARLWEADRPIVLVTDNSAASIALLLGLAVAGSRFLCIERDSSYLSDENSPVRRLDAAALIEPDDRPGAESAPFRRLSYTDMLATGERPVGDAREAEILQLTSGSTGEPRIVRHPFGSVVRGGELYRSIHRYTDRDKVLSPVPVAHSFGLVGGVMASLVAGAELLVMDRFRLRGLDDCLASGASILLGTPLIYQLVASTRPTAERGSQLRVALSSGGPLGPEVAEAAQRRLGCAVHQVYGSTETGLIASQYDRAEPWPADCVGTAAAGVSWRTEPIDGTGAGRRLMVRTSTMFAGYLDSDRIPEPAGAEYDTGDLVRVDERGHLFVVARKDSFINVGGRKVNPGRVERLIAEHPAVLEVSVFGLEYAGEQSVHAAVVLADGVAVADILARCRQRLAPYETPSRLHPVSRLPRTGMGKVDRAELIRMVTPGADRTRAS